MTATTSNETQRTQSFGERMVRTSFNPTEDSAVDRIKKATADLIDTLHAIRQTLRTGAPATDKEEAARCLSIAITNLETACMYAVKGVTAGK